MLKKATILGLVSAAFMAFAAHATGAPSWSHNHERLQKDGTLTITGNAKFDGEVGNVECQMTSMVQLTAESGTAQVDSFHVDAEGAETVTDNC
jgi:hypothetical protein